MRRLFPLILAFTLALPQRASAQLLELQPGQRIRVTAPPVLGTRYDAIIGTRWEDSLSLVKAGAATVRISVSSLQTIEIYRGKSRASGARRGILWGAGIGAALALATLVLPSPEERSTCRDGVCTTLTDLEQTAVLVLAGTIWGAGIGAIVGRERWEPVQLSGGSRSGQRVRPADRFRLGMRMAF